MHSSKVIFHNAHWPRISSGVMVESLCISPLDNSLCVKVCVGVDIEEDEESDDDSSQTFEQLHEERGGEGRRR